MPKLVVHGATLKCSMGSAPASLSVLPIYGTSHTSDAETATVEETLPLANVGSFGMCSAPSNPQVAAATAAASGVLTPQPCMPAVSAPWTPGSRSVTVMGIAALSDACTCVCQWSGQIQVQSAGQNEVDVD